ncbi:uncharacterized protein [Melopsittacus undulatus]|uniref:uncharacterized protein n=1 Tax=Melopsittacus undulatus TaxID=13146 RepID=UPI00146B4DAA|nr:uncharacterized protein LOC117437098 [Melopsittacus undulatus]
MKTLSSFKLLPTKWPLRNKKQKKKKRKTTRESQEQPQQQASVVSNIKGSTSHASQARAPSIPRTAVTTQDRKKMSSVSMRQYSEVGGKQDEAVLEPEGKGDSVGEVKPQLLPEEIHFPEEMHFPDQDQLPPKATHLPGQDQQEALEDGAVDDIPGDTADIHTADSKVGITDFRSAKELLLEVLEHTTEGMDTEKNQSSDLGTVVNYFISEPEDLLCLAAVDDSSLAALSLSSSEPDSFMENQASLLEGCPTPPKYCPNPTLEYEDDTKDIESILESMTSKVLTSTEKLENSGHMGEDRVAAISEGSIRHTPQIHPDPKKLKRRKVNGTYHIPLRRELSAKQQRTRQGNNRKYLGKITQAASILPVTEECSS